MVYDHTNLNHALLISLNELNKSLIDLIKAHKYTEETLLNEAYSTRNCLEHSTEYSDAWLVDRLTQCVMDINTVRSSK